MTADDAAMLVDVDVDPDLVQYLPAGVVFHSLATSGSHTRSGCSKIVDGRGVQHHTVAQVTPRAFAKALGLTGCRDCNLTVYALAKGR